MARPCLDKIPVVQNPGLAQRDCHREEPEKETVRTEYSVASLHLFTLIGRTATFSVTGSGNATERERPCGQFH